MALPRGLILYENTLEEFDRINMGFLSRLAGITTKAGQKPAGEKPKQPKSKENTEKVMSPKASKKPAKKTKKSDSAKASKPTKKATAGKAPSKASKRGAAKAAGAPATPKKKTVKVAKAGAASPDKKKPENLKKTKKEAAPASAKVSAKDTPAGKKSRKTMVSEVKAAAAAMARASDPLSPRPSAETRKKLQKLGHELDSSGRPICREPGCEVLSMVTGYCRLHYIKNWKKIKRKELILKEKKLNRYIEELVAKYPDKYLEVLRQDLSTDAEFAKIVQDMEIAESLDDDDSDLENIDSLIDNIRRDMDDDGEVY